MASTMMKAIRLHEFGGPEVLRYEEAPIPTPKAGEVLIRVRAVGINPPDGYLRDGFKIVPPEMRPPLTLPVIPGSDVSGVIEAVGPDVLGFAVGDEVFGMLRFPSFGDSAAYAEYVAAPASDLAMKPAGIDHLQAAGAPMSGLTAWQFLFDVGHNEANAFQPFQHRPVSIENKTVLINGAAGGVGHLALQLAKWKGAHVIAVASGKHEEFLRDLGADEFIDYAKHAAEEVAKDVDLVLDTLGGAGTSRFLRVIRRGGALYPVFPLGASGLEAAFGLGITVSTTQVRSNGNQLAELAKLLNSGTVRVAVDSTFALADACAAHERVAQGHTQGKIVLSVN